MGEIAKRTQVGFGWDDCMAMTYSILQELQVDGNHPLSGVRSQGNGVKRHRKWAKTALITA
jgi:hypothetical protein